MEDRDKSTNGGGPEVRPTGKIQWRVAEGPSTTSGPLQESEVQTLMESGSKEGEEGEAGEGRGGEIEG